MKRNIYLKMIPLEEAVDLAKNSLHREALLGVESVPVQFAAGRVTAEPVIARYSSPTFHGAAMDGIAVRAESTFAAREGAPVRLEPGRDFAFVNTGNRLPDGMNAVIMIENVVMDGETACIEAPAAPWSHVRRIGEDIVATEMILPRHRRVTPYDVGALLSCGVYEIAAYETVRIVIIPTGDEIMDYTSRPDPGPGQVVESNAMMLCALAESMGFSARRVPPVPDDPEALARAFEAALESDAHAVVLVAGSSAGSKDFSRTTIARFGEVLVHGVAAMPGKPSILGVCRGKLAVGAPGYPVSAVVCFEELLGPICSWLGRAAPRQRQVVTARLARALPSKLGLVEFVRLAVGRVGESYSALPLGRGAGMITTLTKAQAVTRIPANAEGVEAGAEIGAELLVDAADLERTLVAVGSHDNTLDILSDMLMRLAEPVRLASSHVGSMGGLTALKSGAAMLAGSHLFDPATGDFNFPFLKKYLPGMDLVAVNLALRHQGFIIAPGNPKGIRGVSDLARPEVRFVNRQKGAGTRILFDHHLRVAGVDPGRVAGYDHEEFTHMAVAVNVQSGAADCGMGVYAAAKALSLDFLPVARERYDLIIPRVHLDDAKVRAVLAVIGTREFKARLEDLGGYETQLTGRFMEPGMGLGEGPGAS
ncbi:molybdopterin biosynthesis protein [Desulfolutivibrio sulfoxidireducens]|uniref:molybdopterin biosynthesis protein n=1 Tax=Desulfolutivibrio sulfoxidireducens TaxID=2773299 RepID=UPI00159E5A72|nr:molybdopterin biosynthesis protein [Desulfolutivibrio sulfoxidireducens]QLA18147.1 molybdopterin biosynthesis protein [Desulfolutivibrio sulfoxidireducens]QLA21699.1 molybdopterin biosynthesis protein [Desulfolutivibrio sulfoxidireducens]